MKCQRGIKGKNITDEWFSAQYHARHCNTSGVQNVTTFAHDF